MITDPEWISSPPPPPPPSWSCFFLSLLPFFPFFPSRERLADSPESKSTIPLPPNASRSTPKHETIWWARRFCDYLPRYGWCWRTDDDMVCYSMRHYRKEIRWQDGPLRVGHRWRWHEAMKWLVCATSRSFSCSCRDPLNANMFCLQGCHYFPPFHLISMRPSNSDGSTASLRFHEYHVRTVQPRRTWDI